MPASLRICPLCGSTLNADRFAQVMQQHRGIERQLANLRAAEDKAKDALARAKERAKAVAAQAKARAARDVEKERRRAADRLRKHQDTSRKLRAQIENLEHRLKHGETAQSEGLLEEKVLLAFLRDNFPNDAFQHVGKGGDILQDVRTERGAVTGRIVFEVKRVQQWSSAHLVQCAEAVVLRQADIGILVTNRFPATRKHFFVERGVLVISPMALLPLVHTAREGLLNVYALRASGDQRKKAVEAVYEYLAGGQYSGHIRRVSQHLTDLELLFKKEVSTHERVWNDRVRHYRGIVSGVSGIHDRLRQVVGPTAQGTTGLPGTAQKLLPQFPSGSRGR